MKSLIFRVTKKYEGRGNCLKREGLGKKEGSSVFEGGQYPNAHHEVSSCANLDRKLLCQWICSNKLSFDDGRTEIFKHKQQEIMKHLNFRMRIGLNKMHEKRTKTYLIVDHFFL